MWLMPPIRNSQITLLAFGAKWGRPSGGAQPASPSARARPSRWSIEERTSPVKPIPQSARRGRRDTPLQRGTPDGRFEFMAGGPSADGHEVVMVQQNVDDVFAGAEPRVVGRLDGRRRAGGEPGQLRLVGEPRRMTLDIALAFIQLVGRGRTRQ